MSFGKLLAAGKSIAGGRDGGRYKVDPRVFLPKFVSPKNPFAQPPNKDASEQTVSLVTPAQSLSKQAADTDARAAVPVRIDEAAPRVSVGNKILIKCVALVSKVNPLKLLKRRTSGARAAMACFRKSPVQEEFPLERVQVVRNDLTDADIEFVSLGKKSTNKREPGEGAWERIATRVFGTETT